MGAKPIPGPGHEPTRTAALEEWSYGGRYRGGGALQLQMAGEWISTGPRTLKRALYREVVEAPARRLLTGSDWKYAAERRDDGTMV